MDFGATERDVEIEDLDRLRGLEGVVKELLMKAGKLESGELTAYDLDCAHKYLRAGTLFSRRNRDNTVYLLGACYGQLMVREHGFKWIAYKDHLGEELAVKHEKSEWIAFPFSSVRKRVRSRRGTIFQELEDSLIKGTRE